MWKPIATHGEYTVWAYQDETCRAVYQVTKGEMPIGTGGYRNIAAMLRLKGIRS